MNNRKDSNLKLAIIIFFLTLIALVIYSYSQIDLNLTLSTNTFYQAIQKQLITLGYFKRTLSTAIFILILFLLSILQIFFLRFAYRKKLTGRSVWKLSIVSAAVLLFAYPAFSHDIFNYMFDARLLVTHRVSPWEFTALDFPQDLWTRFMRWTHRTYPYGPLWLSVSIPFYLAGLGKFSLTLFWFKTIGAISYLVSVWCVKKILESVSPKNTATGMILFALNPLILIETLVTAHLDAAMSAIFLGAIYLLAVKKKSLASWILLLSSAAIKFVTAAAVPIWIWWRGNNKRFEQAIAAMLTLTLLTTVVVVLNRELLPWYFITPLALSALLPEKKRLHAFGFALSLGLLLRYAPYLFRGDYSEWVRTTRNWLTASPIVAVTAGLIWLKKKSFL